MPTKPSRTRVFRGERKKDFIFVINPRFTDLKLLAAYTLKETLPNLSFKDKFSLTIKSLNAPSLHRNKQD